MIKRSDLAEGDVILGMFIYNITEEEDDTK